MAPPNHGTSANAPAHTGSAYSRGARCEEGETRGVGRHSQGCGACMLASSGQERSGCRRPFDVSASSTDCHGVQVQNAPIGQSA